MNYVHVIASRRIGSYSYNFSLVLKGHFLKEGRATSFLYYKRAFSQVRVTASSVKNIVTKKSILEGSEKKAKRKNSQKNRKIRGRPISE